jgi:hypothetical protein
MTEYEMNGMTGSTHGEIRNAYSILVGKPQAWKRSLRRHVDGRTTLKLISEKTGVKVQTQFRIGSNCGLL